MIEQMNPFTGGGSGPNWQAAEAAWTNFTANTQGGAPQPNAIFLGNMAGKGCPFYNTRLTAQMNSFVNQFGGSFGAGSNASNSPSQGSNPAWQSEKYARIMWLAAKVQDCNNQGSGTSGGFGSTSVSTVQCINDWIDDPSNDNPLLNAVCANGNQALSQNNIQTTKFRHKSRADCTTINDKIDSLNDQLTVATGCAIQRKTAKRDYLTALKAHCC